MRIIFTEKLSKMVAQYENLRDMIFDLNTLFDIRSCFLRIFVSTTAIIYYKLFSLTLRKFVMLMWSLYDAFEI